MALVFLTGSAFKASWLFVALAGLPLVGALMTANLEAAMKIAAEAVRDAMHAAKLTDDEAAWHMDIQVGQLRRQLRAEPGAHIAFARLIMMPFAFWMNLGPAIIFIAAKRAFRQVSEDVSARRVS